MSVQRRVRAVVMTAASAVILGGLGYGIAGADTVRSGPLVQPVTSARATTFAVPVAAATTTTKSSTASKPTTTKPTTAKPATPRPAIIKATTPTTLKFSVVTPKVTKAQFYRAVFRGQLVNTKTKAGVTAQDVILMRRVAGASGWTRVVSATTSAPDGKILIAVEQTVAKADYKVIFVTKAPYLASSSGVVSVTRG